MPRSTSLALALALTLGACRAEEPRGFFQRPPRGQRFVGSVLVPVDDEGQGGWSTQAPDTLDRLRAAGPEPGLRPLPAFQTFPEAAPSPLPAHSARVLARDGSALSIEGFQMLVRVDGGRARVLAELFVLNDQPAAVAARLDWRLPDGASPTGAVAARESGSGLSPRFRLAEDPLPSTLRARPPRPAEAAATLGLAPGPEAARPRPAEPAADPWAGSGVLRVPLPALEPERLYRVTAVYERDLEARDGRFVLDLPMPPRVPYRCIDLSIAGLPEGSLRLDPPAPLSREAGRLRARYEKPGIEVITLSASASRGLVLASEGGFAIDVLVPDLPEEGAAPAARALFMLDISASMGRAAFDDALAFIDAVLREGAPAPGAFAVLAFNNEPFLWEGGYGANSPERRVRFQARARSWAREGSTELERAWSLIEAQDDGAPTDIYLISDGRFRAPPPRSLGAHRGRSLFVLRLADAPPVYERQASESGGAVIFLGERPSRAQVVAAARAPRRRPWTLRQARLPGGQALVGGGPLRSGSRLRLFGAGPWPADTEELRLTVQRGQERRELVCPLAPAVASPLWRRARAAALLERFDAELEGEASSARRLALAFAVPGRAAVLTITSEAPKAAAASSDEAALFPGPGGFGARRRDPLLTLLEALSPAAGQDARLRALIAASEPRRAPGFGEAPEASAALPRAYVAGLDAGLTREAIEAEAWRRARRGKSSAALRALSSALEGAPEDRGLRRDLAFSALALGLPDRVESLLGEAALDDLENLLLLGLARREAGRPAAARAAAELGRRSAPQGSVLAAAFALEAGLGSGSPPALLVLWNREDWEFELGLRGADGRRLSWSSAPTMGRSCAVASLAGLPAGVGLTITGRGAEAAGPRRARVLIAVYRGGEARLQVLDLPRDRRGGVMARLDRAD